MRTSVERVDETTVKLSITLEAAEVDAAVDQAARRLAKDVRIPGFRPGRAPRKVLERRLGSDTLREEAVRESLPGYYSRAVDAEGLDVVSAPEFDVDEFAGGQDATFTATVQVRPEIEVPDYEGLQVAHPEWEVTDEEVSEQLEALRERFATLESVKRAADVGSYVRMTVTGERDGQRVDEASGEDVLYEVREPGQTSSELDRSLVGAEAGAILKFRDSLGPEYGELAGEELDFTVIVKEVKARRLPALDDDFAGEASEFDTLAELEAELRAQMSRVKRARARAELRGKVVEAVSELVDVPLPQALVQQELSFRLHQLGHEAQRYGMQPEQYVEALGSSAQDLYAQLEADAQRTVRAQLVVDAIGRAQGVEVGTEDLEAEIVRQAQRVGREPDELVEYMTHPDRIGALASDAFRRKTIDHLLEHVQVLSAPPPVEDEDEVLAEADDSHEAAAALAAREAAAAAAQASAGETPEPAGGKEQAPDGDER